MGKESFGKTPDGTEIFVYTLHNKNGMEARVTNYGGTLLSLLVPDRNGNRTDVVLGFDSLATYIKDAPHFGSTMGRYANRIGKAMFQLNGIRYTLARNSGANHIHGGLKGFDKVAWNVDEHESKVGKSLVLNYLSRDGEEGYPGNLSVKVMYSVTDSNGLKIEYTATTDKPTVMNLTNHSYFNLAGAGNGSILDHELFIDADRFTPVDTESIPTGELRSVHGTPLDFTTPTRIGVRIDDGYEQLKKGGGYNHNLVLNKPANAFGLAARVYEETSGRVMEVLTTEPGLQFYTPNFVNAKYVGKEGKKYDHRCGFCLETEHFPDSPNKPQFPSTVVNPGDTYTSTTVYRFSTR
ncbi:MAG: aldose epimerase family protein [Ignavibacteria bacterium]|nr:aldose epimerase family protein [Ignavibacteria bacterium]